VKRPSFRPLGEISLITPLNKARNRFFPQQEIFFSRQENIFSQQENIFPQQEILFFTAGKYFSTAENIFFTAGKYFSTAGKYFFTAGNFIFYGRKIYFSRQEFIFCAVKKNEDTWFTCISVSFITQRDTEKTQRTTEFEELRKNKNVTLKNNFS